MPLRLQTSHPLADPRLAELIDAAFERPRRESRLVSELAKGDPSFDPGMSLVALDEQRALGYALFLPRRMRIAGEFVRLAVASPFGVRPEARRSGVGDFLLRTGLQALRDREIRGVVALGGQEFYAHHGFEPAFNLYTIEARLADLPAAGESPWRGLRSPDLAVLRELAHACYVDVDGSEERSAHALDWESSVENAHTLVLEREGTAAAYVHFRVRGELEVRECAARDAAAVEQLLAFLARLMTEHGRARMELHLPPPHPVARALFHRGAAIACSNFRGAALLRVLDWPGLLRDTHRRWEAALALAQAPISLGIEGQHYRLSAPRGALEVESGAQAALHAELPAGLASGLLTGQRSWRELAFGGASAGARLGPRAPELLRALFPEGSPTWTYSPVFELADD